MAVKVILDWNARHQCSPIRLEAVLWERYAASENRGDGEGAQEPINRQLVDSCDFAIGIFWTRIGTPTKLAPGGAVEEVQRILAGKKPVMLYFSNVASRPNEIDTEQKAKLDSFKQQMQRDGLVWEYQERHEFENQLARHLDYNLSHWFPDSSLDSGNEPRCDLKELFLFQATLKTDLGSIAMLGLPGVESIRVNLDDNTFVPLRLSDKPNDRVYSDGQLIMPVPERDERIYYPDALMKRAFHDGRGLRLLLIIGDPGAGKTTLLKYYALCALDMGRSGRLGFAGRIHVFYLPLRELDRNLSLPANLSLWYKQRHHTLAEDVFLDWLQDGTSLVLLDGLDEISNTEKRKEVCRWIDNAWIGFDKAFFVVTSRGTGYRKEEEVELESDYDRADVQDFKPEQQESFIKNWFTAAFLKEPCDEGVDITEWQQIQRSKAADRTKKMVEHLKEEKNKGLRQLAAVPMILQIMAILWKEKDYMPESRVKLYDSALNYLLEIRDKRRGIVPEFTKKGNGNTPCMSVDRTRRVLAPVSLWMQAELHSDKAGRAEMQANMQKTLDTFDNAPAVEEFCDYLVKRTGVLVAYGRDYLFRHKTFREYLASIELHKKVLRNPEDLDKVITSFGEDWWDEPIKFFIAQGDDDMFDLFMHKFFNSSISDSLTLERQLLLRTIIEEAPQKKADALCQKLLDPETTAGQQRIILDCIKAVNKPAALVSLEKFRAKNLARTDDVADRAEEVILAFGGKPVDRSTEKRAGRNSSWRNEHEDNAEYILIPNGRYLFSKTNEEELVENIYFAKYPVTNKRYRSFIAALNKETALQKKLIDIAQNNPWDSKFPSWLKGGGNDLVALFSSKYDEDRKFGGDEQPVVGIPWYAARAYCLWLSQLEDRADSYRLPSEIEWEWAAGGRHGEAVQKVREYPWADEKGEPCSTLLNYNDNVGATTRVGSYPEGATPEGLYDMAGNVWEWTDSWWDDTTRSRRVIRGGGWSDDAGSCRSSYRSGSTPGHRSYDVGFRPVFVP
ncbi:MAG: SUMF1/EgtB/PvdO family nonheme iron enzyme [Chlorobium sp.]|nr:SUMF1/EgtB/PvdO family nonheme iron enzyme [Chlorobium sp.]MCF8271006.1 SUMF1/EgtB/PvdO family nonheme iron enzyme [Chlorobium sp.]MCF8287348.1 SUMF1/EgtB/PvdO family nonheme iron enzyme [Chlorobium sp.]MCF8290919.1 SUMF1/EgtB/PvdO family nonheme iron enzyme [Chlorobium sp.]MCF8385014.1 SUMF1/EgtB/PvdO family nonheme iron enzyme [Chlorobium sp.]